MNFKNKKILITAGPTWIAVDAVRVISNFATGETGILLAEKFNKSGAKVTLILGPVGNCSLNKRIKLERFCFYQELKSGLQRELKKHRYDAVIHTAAVSDYQMLRTFRHKIRSGIKKLSLELGPTPKIINSIKKIAPYSLAVGFKFEPGASREKIIRESKGLLRRAGLDLVVANTITKKSYRAYIVSPRGTYGPFRKKQVMVRALADLIKVRLCGN